MELVNESERENYASVNADNKILIYATKKCMKEKIVFKKWSCELNPMQ